MRPTGKQITQLNEKIGGLRLRKWRVAVDADVNPVRLYGMLAGRVPMSPAVYQRVREVLRVREGEPA